MGKTKGKTEMKDLTPNEKSNLQADMKRFGYLLPTNDEELEEFNKIFGKTQVMFPEHLKRPSFLHGEQAVKKPEVSVQKAALVKAKASVKSSKTPAQIKNDYFKKLVLAAEIAYQLHEEPTFGHVKFVKVFLLCDHVCNMKLSSAYGKYAAGPLDPKQMYSIDSEFKNRKWFSVTKTDYGYRYHPGEKLDEYRTYYGRYFRNSSDGIARILSLFRKQKSDFCEIVATIFYLWKEYLDNHKLVNDASLIKDFYDWDEKKKRFPEKDILNAIAWMNENEITPVLNNN
ncbi:MAG: hypothetical protein DI539_16300 [Flavobacterium psychrophilum]|nr:MAG: hypothetical protein DI539_16300 [Flavobacterium psychrophilum]